MNKTTFSGYVAILVLMFSGLTTFATGEVPDGILTALKTGNSKELAKFFNTNVELTIIDKEDVYSKTQAEIIVKEFFTKNPPTGFSTLHMGGSEGSKYVIGNLTTQKGTYRVYFLLKSQGNTQVIQQLRIETGNE